MAGFANGGLYQRAGLSSKLRRKKALKRSAILAEALEGRMLLSRIIFVDWQDHNGPDSNDGTTWQSAYTDLQQAMAAAVSGDEIRVAAGTYKPTAGTDRTATFQLKSGVGLYGGYAGFGSSNPDARDIAAHATILSGEIGNPSATTDNSYHVVTGSGVDATAILDGFTITAGRANGASPHNCGAGMYNSGGSPTLRGCRFVQNAAGNNGSGGGMYNHSASPSLIACSFDGNSAGEEGGGMHNVASSPVLIDCVFQANTAEAGGGLSNYLSFPDATGCIFQGNMASAEGGGIFNSGSSPRFTRCSFSRNSATSTSTSAKGGGMYNRANSSPTLIHCIFSGNSAKGSPSAAGGGMCNISTSPLLFGCVFVGNSTSGNGGAISNDGVSSSPRLINCTLAGNSAYRAGAMYNYYAVPTVTNCILWGNSATIQPEIHDAAGKTTATYSNIKGGFVGTGNHNADPQFIRNPHPGTDGDWGTFDDDHGDLRLRLPSPAVDAAHNAAVPEGVLTDLAGNPRFVDVRSVDDTGMGDGPVVDMGAYETRTLEAVTGGPYTVLLGGSIVLSGYGHCDLSCELAYEWDLDGDGQFDDGTGPSPVFSTQDISGPLTLSIALRVTGGSGESRIGGGTLIVAAPVVYVDASASGTGNGQSWRDAYTDLQSALVTSIPQQTIRVAQGVYTPTRTGDRTASFVLRNGVTVCGGYAGSSAPDPNERDTVRYVSILSGDIGIAGNDADNSHHVLVGGGADRSAVLDGFMITGGKADGKDADVRGAAIYNYFSSPTLINCTFAGNTATSGAIYNRSASPAFINCVFLENTASSGGAVYNESGSSPTFTGCTFLRNSAAYRGGAIFNNASSPILTNCTFSGNSARTGGGMDNLGASAPMLTQCVFDRNTTSEEGGGIRHESSTGASTLIGCTFSGNRSLSLGGGAYTAGASLTFVICTFVGNSAHAGGGGVYAASGSVKVINSTFSSNAVTGPSGAGGGGLFAALGPVVVINSIFWGNTSVLAAQIRVGSGSIAVTYSDVQGGFVGAGNIDADPRFMKHPHPGADGVWGTADDDYGDLRLQAASPCVDAGRNNAPDLAGIAIDAAGGNRFLDVPTTPDTGVGVSPIVDIGAYEAVPALAASAGGPYTIVEGRELILRGRGASTVSGELQYEWDWTGSGQFHDAVGMNPRFPVSNWPALSVVTVSLRVTDASGQSGIGTTTVTVVPQVLYVDDDAVGSNDGTSWQDAIVDLADALARAVEGQEIRVAAGTYKPTITSDRTFSFVLKNGVVLRGGYAGSANPTLRNHSAYVSVLSGDIGIIGNKADNCDNVVVGSGTNSSAILDGFTITGGGRTWGGGMFNLRGSPTVIDCLFVLNAASEGGGLYNSEAAPTLINCIFKENSASYGGAMYNWLSSPTLINCNFIGNSAYEGGAMQNNNSSPTLIDCTFTNNQAQGNGGGAMSNRVSSTPVLIDCVFINNAATHANGVGGGMFNESSSPKLIGCAFIGNHAKQGGGMQNSHNAVPTVDRCTFVRNTAQSGGGMFNYNGSAARLTGCTFTGNTANAGRGGAIMMEISGTIVINCIFIGNSAVGINGFGGAIYSASTATVTNCTFSNNVASQAGGGICNYGTLNIINSVLWGNSAPTNPQIHRASGTVTATYCLVQGGHAGIGNIATDPLFVRNPSSGLDSTWGTADDDYGDVRVKPTSLCIDAGRNDAVPVGVITDHAGLARFADVPGVIDTGVGPVPVVDLGAYEAGSAAASLLLAGTNGAEVMTFRLSPDGQSIHVWNSSATVGQPLVSRILAGITSCTIIPSPGVDTVRLDFANGAPIPPGGLILPSDDQILIPAGAETRAELLESIRSLLRTGRIASASADPLRALSPSINDDGDILIRLALRGDLNYDGVLDGDDYFEMDRAFLMQNPLKPQADLTLDGRVDAEDFFILDKAFLTLSRPPVAAGVAAATEWEELDDLAEVLR